MTKTLDETLDISELLEELENFDEKAPKNEKYILKKRWNVVRKCSSLVFITTYILLALSLLHLIDWNSGVQLEKALSGLGFILGMGVAIFSLSGLSFCALEIRKIFLEIKYDFNHLIKSHERDRKNMLKLKRFSNEQIIEAKRWLKYKKNRVDVFAKGFFKISGWAAFITLVSKMLDVFGVSLSFNLISPVYIYGAIIGTVLLTLTLAAITEVFTSQKIRYRIFVLDSVLENRILVPQLH